MRILGFILFIIISSALFHYLVKLSMWLFETQKIEAQISIIFGFVLFVIYETLWKDKS